jgi:hypothetical protein
MTNVSRKLVIADDDGAVHCSCGERLVVASADQYQAALDLAARNHRGRDDIDTTSDAFLDAVDRYHQPELAERDVE